MAWQIWVASILAGTSIYNSSKNRRAGNRANDMANQLAAENMARQNEIAEEQLAFQKEEAAKLEAQKDIYRNMEFKNPYESVKNPYEGLQTDFENLYEDLTIDTRAAEFRAQQGQQQRANILSNLRQTAGSSGIAGLAQALANQGQLQAQQDSITIAQQERQNQMMSRQGAAQVRQLETGREQLIAQGEATAEMTRLGGEAALQEMEMSRQATLLGIQMGQTSGANQALQQAYANQMAAGAGQANLYGQQASGLYGLAGQQYQSGMNLFGDMLTLS